MIGIFFYLSRRDGADQKIATFDSSGMHRLHDHVPTQNLWERGLPAMTAAQTQQLSDQPEIQVHRYSLNDIV
ncbi:hypothetical protein AB7M29_004616 [Pseudomonas sp. F-14 TE3623]|uniref:Uncharacterized protein n=1 Tax=Pseudomonas farris TaxID=2841207 RepID=A0ABS6Q262_9PSED|nr:hypothetical protein [Pseudomonas farris]MBV4466808.1 hypothetical protein [Pseudomonas farris]